MISKNHVINGDPLTFENRDCHIDLHWYGRIFYDQLYAYKDESPVNEHANESKGWKEFLETIPGETEAMDIDVRWWEYKGISCTDKEPSPLIVCMNENYTSSWQHVADENGLIILTFEYHRNFTLPPEGMGAMGFDPSMREIKGYKKVVDRVIKKYNIDCGRIYLNGLSYGDMTSLLYAKEYGDTLAGIVLINGPSSPYNLKKYELPGNLPEIPSMQLRSESELCVDGFPDGMSFDAKGNYEWLRFMRSQMSLMNRDLWLVQNKVKGYPKISSRGKCVYLKYEGEKAPVIYNENYHRSHLPPIDFSQVMWDNLFNVYKRDENGNIVKTGNDKLAPDAVSIALAVGSSKAYINYSVEEL